MNQPDVPPPSYGRWPSPPPPPAHPVWMNPAAPPPPPPNPGREAGSALMSGFAGCLGVGLAIILVIVVLAIFIAVANHH
jgi:predicted lipid-binding transport protein (Tim44 family)